MDYVYYSDHLEHHGILGMKWGVRRYQNEDGTLTDAGKRHYKSDNLTKSAFSDSARQAAYRGYSNQLKKLEKKRDKAQKYYDKDKNDGTKNLLKNASNEYKTRKDIMDKVMKKQMNMSVKEINYRKARDDWEKYTKQNDLKLNLLIGAVPMSIYGMYRTVGTKEGRKLTKTYQDAHSKYFNR